MNNRQLNILAAGAVASLCVLLQLWPSGMQTAGASLWVFVAHWLCLAAPLVMFFRNPIDAKGEFGLRAHQSWKADGFFHWLMWPLAAFSALILLQLISLFQFDFSFNGYSQHLQSQMRVFEEPTRPCFHPSQLPKTGLLQLCIVPFSPLIHGQVIAGEELAFRGWLLNRLPSNGDE